MRPPRPAEGKRDKIPVLRRCLAPVPLTGLKGARCFRPLGKVRKKERKEAKARRPQNHTRRQERAVAFPHCPPVLLPSVPDTRAQAAVSITSTPRAPHWGWGCLEGLGAPPVLEPAAPRQAVRPRGAWIRGKGGDNGEGDGRGRSRSQARGKFLVRGKHFQPSFTMTPAGSFLHNLVYFGRKQQRRNPLPPPRGTGGSPASPFPGLPLQRT